MTASPQSTPIRSLMGQLLRCRTRRGCAALAAGCSCGSAEPRQRTIEEREEPFAKVCSTSALRVRPGPFSRPQTHCARSTVITLVIAVPRARPGARCNRDDGRSRQYCETAIALISKAAVSVSETCSAGFANFVVRVRRGRLRVRVVRTISDLRDGLAAWRRAEQSIGLGPDNGRLARWAYGVGRGGPVRV